MRSATPSGRTSKSRRLDLHQHREVYRTAAFLFGHVGTSSSAGSRTPRGGFGDRLLARKHTAMAPGLAAGSRRNDYFCNSTFQYASLMNFDQLAIRIVWSAYSGFHVGRTGLRRRRIRA